MSVERMKLLSITGKQESIDKFIADYLLNSGIQTENAVKVFEKGWKLKNFIYDSTAKELLNDCKKLFDKYKIKYDEKAESENVDRSLESIQLELADIINSFEEYEKYIQENEKELEDINNKLDLLKNTKDLDVDLKKLYDLEYLKFRYGKVSKESFGKLEKNLKDINSIVLKTAEDDSSYVWMMVFIPKDNIVKGDSYLNMFKFERMEFPEEIGTNPKEAFTKYENRIQELLFNLNNKKEELANLVDRDTEYLLGIYKDLNLYIKINNVKRYLAYDENGQFYMIGWIPTKELAVILPKLHKEKDIKFDVKNHDEVASIPPTKLKNYWLFRPFEVLVKMYGLPNYTELDPTPFVAITAFLLFGFMFGDVGHGLLIIVIGLLMMFKKSEMGPVFMAGGLASMIFGVLYGSIFGLEGIIPAILISPMESIERMLIYGIGFGVVLIFISMLLNIKNGIKNKDLKRVFLDTNGIAGLVFYLTVLIAVVYFLKEGKMIVSLGILAVCTILPLLIIMFKDVIAKYLFKEKSDEESSLVEKVFEIVELLLSFTSNTISFVRTAAFAINHVGLCMAIYILSDMFSKTGSITVAIFGNALVIVLEGLIVGIQVLRLEYYELFSRFYTGDGKEYKPLKEKI